MSAAWQPSVARWPHPGRTGHWYGAIVVVRVLEADLRPMERKLVAALAIRRPAPVSVSSLTDALWGDEPPPSARKTIQTNVLRVRAKLGRDAIETVSESYRLGAHVEVDIERFERAVRDALASPGASTARWDAALAWCDDEALDEFDHWRPADGRRAQLDELRSVATEARWEAALEEGSPSDLIPDLEAFVADEPLRERRWALLLTAYQRAARTPDGLRAFERARRTLAEELGVSPGRELVGAYESLLREESGSTGAPGAERSRSFALVSLADQQTAEALAARSQGDDVRAVKAFIAAAAQARDAEDVRRFAEAALGAAGDGWRARVDATDEIVTLLDQALDHVPSGPTQLRSRLLARWAVVCSHHKPVAECEAAATKALAIARAVDDQRLIAGALHALSVVVWDPARHLQHWDWTDELLRLSKQHPEEPWHRWALPIVARLRAEDGDLAGAADALDELAIDAERCGDAGALFDASYLPLLRATVRGDWAAASRAASQVRDACEAALFDPLGAALQEMGMLSIISLLSGPTDVPPLPPIEWPMPSMELNAKSWHANCLARAGQTADAVTMLDDIDLTFVVDGDRDTYWLATLSMLADAAHLASHAPTAAAVWECLRPLVELTVLDGALIYRGAAAHFAGLAATACGYEREARELLAEGLERHAAHQSPWMVRQSEAAIEKLEGRCQ